MDRGSIRLMLHTAADGLLRGDDNVPEMVADALGRLAEMFPEAEGISTPTRRGNQLAKLVDRKKEPYPYVSTEE